MAERHVTRVRQLLARKNTGQIGVLPDDTVLKALEVMAESNIGAVLVLDGERLVGIFSERDYARKVELKGRTAVATHVKDLMTTELVTVSSDETVEECNVLMRQHHIRHLPVIENGKLVGVLSSRDVLTEVVADEEKDIKSLEIERRLVESGLY
ncbi:CBS domain-containing protein [Enterovirga sp.]|uniref:CBS domain-containing protein n=1 Tax=Enterovirga sp. TaxID=2026350 RepID=UPI002C374D88|nr:CBS domain-containing protein [Enterovirga sp.]HMO28905.1 CBS domain-containing protein [Enterovirga sp.]